jgi:hypothetical protein
MPVKHSELMLVTFCGSANGKRRHFQSAIDFIKYILALAGGAIAFVIQPSFYQTSHTIQVLSSWGVGLLAVSIIAGITAHSAGTVMLSKKNYDTNFPWFRFPGMIMMAAFVLGFVCVIVALGIKVWR